MARRAEAQKYEENPIPVPFEFRKELEDGSTVELELSMDRGKTWERKGSPETAACTPPNTKEIFKFGWTESVPEGTLYNYRFKVTKPGGAIDLYPKNKKNFAEAVAREAAPSTPSAKTPLSTVQSTIKSRLQSVLESSRSGEEVSGIDALVSVLSSDLDAMRIKNHKPEFIIHLLMQVIQEMEKMPGIIKRYLKNLKKMPDSYEGLINVMQAAGELYRQRIFFRLKANKEARERFGLKADSRYDKKNPLGKNSEAFFRVCAEHGDVTSVAPYLGVALKSVDDKHKRNPKTPKQIAKQQKLLQKRAELAEKIATFKEESKGMAFMKDVPDERKGRLLDAAATAAIIGGGIATGSIFIPASVFAVKAGIQALTGTSTGDMLSGKNFWKTAAKRNVVKRALVTKGSSFDVVKDMLKDGLKTAIPGYSVFATNVRPGEHSEEEIPDEGSESYSEEVKLFRAACEEEK